MTAATFSSEYARWFPQMVNYARRQHGIADPENVVQQVWAQAWQRKHQYDGRASIRTWAYAIMRNLIRDIRRRPENRALEFAADPPELPLRPNYNAAIDVELLLAAMTPNERVVVTLYHLAEIPFEEMAEMTDRPENTLKTMAFRGRKRAAEYAKGAHELTLTTQPPQKGRILGHAESAA